MPSDRFLKLEKEKQERIIKAARREFSHVPYERASINKIIQYAGISRGSFYTYFEDKEDLLAYIFQEEERVAAAYLQERMARGAQLAQEACRGEGKIYREGEPPHLKLRGDSQETGSHKPKGYGERV